MMLFAAELSRRTGLPITIASGLRTLDEQAWILRSNADTYGPEKAFAAYGQQRRDALTAAYRQDDNLAEIRAVEARYVPASGAHLTGEAIDVVSAGSTAAQKDAVERAAKDMGAALLREYAPEHFHVGHIERWAGWPGAS